jgi:hypothetical protein
MACLCLFVLQVLLSWWEGEAALMAEVGVLTTDQAQALFHAHALGPLMHAALQVRTRER